MTESQFRLRLAQVLSQSFDELGMRELVAALDATPGYIDSDRVRRILRAALASRAGQLTYDREADIRA